MKTNNAIDAVIRGRSASTALLESLLSIGDRVQIDHKIAHAIGQTHGVVFSGADKDGLVGVKISGGEKILLHSDDIIDLIEQDIRLIESVVKPLYGHKDEHSAYMVDDYPYGSMRCRIRYWLEFSPSKGYRFVSQTENPKNLKWNNPKKSTYVDFAAAMFLDEKGHVQWVGIGAYSDGSEVLEFVKQFHGADFSKLKPYVLAKIRFIEKEISGEVVWTINKEPIPRRDSDVKRLEKELEDWKEVAKHLNLSVK